MQKIIRIAVSITLCFIFVASVSAEEQFQPPEKQRMMQNGQNGMPVMEKQPVQIQRMQGTDTLMKERMEVKMGSGEGQMMKMENGQRPGGLKKAREAFMERKEDRIASREAYVNELKDRREALSQKKQELQQKTQLIKTKTQQRVMSAKCNAATQVSENVTQRYESNHQGLVVRFDNMLERLTKLEQKFAAEGQDTTILKEEIAGLTELVTKLKTDFDTFISITATIKEFTCEEVTADAKDSYNQAREALNVVKEDAKAIQEYYQERVRPEIMQLKEASRPTEPTTTPTL